MEDVMKSSLSISAPGGRTLAKRLRVVAACIALCVAPVAFSPASAQSDPGYAPAREGNIYDHQRHQPTGAELCPAGVSPSINCPSDSARLKLEHEVQRLLRDTDADLRVARERLDNPNGSTPWSRGVR
jgi:hypothetical protein